MDAKPSIVRLTESYHEIGFLSRNSDCLTAAKVHIDKYRYNAYYHIDIYQCEMIAWS